MMKEEEKQQEKEDEAEVKEEIPGGNPEDESSRTCYIDHPLRKKKSVDGLVKMVALPKLCFRLPASRGASIGKLFTIHALFVSGVGGWMQLEWTARVSR